MFHKAVEKIRVWQEFTISILHTGLIVSNVFVLFMSLHILDFFLQG